MKRVSKDTKQIKIFDQSVYRFFTRLDDTWEQKAAALRTRRWQILKHTMRKDHYAAP